MPRYEPPTADPPLQSHPAIVAIMEALRIGPSARPATRGAPAAAVGEPTHAARGDRPTAPRSPRA